MGFYRFRETHHRRNFYRNPEKFSGTPDMPDIMGLTFVFVLLLRWWNFFFGLQYKKVTSTLYHFY